MNQQFAILVIQLLLQYGPEVAAKFVEIWHKSDPTLEDWQAIFALAKKPIARVDESGNIVVPPAGT